MARKIGLLLLILIAGGAVDAAWIVRREVGFNIGASGCRIGGGRFSGPSYSFQSEERRVVAAGDTIEVENQHGDVNVTQGGATEMRVVLRKVVYQQNEPEARALAEQLHLKVDGTGRVRVGTNRGDVEGQRPQVGFETHLDLQVPSSVSVVIRNEHGSVDVADVAGAQVENAYSDVRIERVGGAASVELRHGDISVSVVKGALTVTARHGNVEVADVEGSSSVDSEHGDVTLRRVHAARVQAQNGSLRFEDVRGDLEVHGQHADVEADKVEGAATIETTLQDVTVRHVTGQARLTTQHGQINATDVTGGVQATGSFEDVTLERIGGPVEVTVTHGGLRAKLLQKGGRVSASGGDVVVDGFAGPLEVQNERADVELRPASALREPLIVRTSFGEVRVQVPPGSEMKLDAASPGGDLDIDVPGLALTRGEGQRATGVMGAGGNEVRLFAEHGRVRVSPALAKSNADNGDDDTTSDDGKDDGSSDDGNET